MTVIEEIVRVFSFDATVFMGRVVFLKLSARSKHGLPVGLRSSF